MAAHSVFKIIGGSAVAMAWVLTGSYSEERPKYQFERATVEAIKEWPAARIVSSVKTIDPASLLSWVWPTTVSLSVAVPDRQMANRFYVSTASYDVKTNSVFLIDADCRVRELTQYGLNEPESAFPALDWLGLPVKTSNGQTYRLFEPKYALPPEWLHAFCDTDWTAERSAAAWAP